MMLRDLAGDFRDDPQGDDRDDRITVAESVGLTLIGRVRVLKKCHHTGRARYTEELRLMHFYEDTRFRDAPQGVYVVAHLAPRGGATFERFASYSGACVRMLALRKTIGHMSAIEDAR